MELTKAEEKIKNAALSDVKYLAAKRNYCICMWIVIIDMFFVGVLVLQHGNEVQDYIIAQLAWLGVIAFWLSCTYGYKYDVYGLIRKMNMNSKTKDSCLRGNDNEIENKND